MEQRTPPKVTVPTPQPIHGHKAGLAVKPHWYQNRKRLILTVIGGIIALLVLAALSILIWYSQAIRPLSNDKNKHVIVEIDKGMGPTAIGTLLQKDGVIKSATAFIWYTRLTRSGGNLQFGTYRLTPSDSVPAIVKHLTNGDVDTFQMTFLPGGTLADAKAAFLDAGYSQTDIDTAFAKSYTGLVFTDKPATANLEGYFYGDSYDFNAGTSVEDILQTIFDHYSDVVKSNDLISAYQKQGLSLYQGIILASIIQREMGSPDPNTPSSDEKQVAQVFYSRLATGMPLGSDVTYQYAAKLMGVTPSPSLDSPYNTRIHTGLPPGPIATPSKAALLATASPAPGDYLYFLSGDDGTTYFAHTEAEHEANIQNHCQQKCSTEQ